jgi:hypothetical protein
MCEENKKNLGYYERDMDTAAKYIAWLMQTGHISNDINLVTCHREAHQLGFANNHGDILDWCVQFGDSAKNYMVNFRKRIQAHLDMGPINVTMRYGSVMNTCKQSTKYSTTARYMQVCLNHLGYTCDTDGLFMNETVSALKKFQGDHGIETTGICDQSTWAALMKARNDKVAGVSIPAEPSVPVVTPPSTDITGQHYYGTVKTQHQGWITMRKNIHQLLPRVCKIPDGELVEVTANCVSGTTIASSKWGKYCGYVDTQYLVNRTNVE